jgi:self-protective colicin-like immunity protein
VVVPTARSYNAIECGVPAVDEFSADVVRALHPHRELIAEFVANQISADAFETLYLTRYLGDQTHWPRELFDVLDRLFAEVDDYVGDDDLRERAGGLDPAGLRECARQALRRLDLLGPAMIKTQ